METRLQSLKKTVEFSQRRVRIFARLDTHQRSTSELYVWFCLLVLHCFPNMAEALTRKSVALFSYRLTSWVHLVNFPIFQLQHKDTAKQTNLKAPPTPPTPYNLSPFIGSWYMNKRLSRLKKATAEALPDLRTFVTNGVSSLTLSCLTKTSPHLKQHPSVLVGEQWQIAFPQHSKHLDPFSTPPLLFMVNSLNNSWAMGIYKLINCLLGATAMPHTPPSAS